jgi:apolipoprotein N-acyltransferase
MKEATPERSAALAKATDCALALLAVLLLVLAFPNFYLGTLAWIGIAPLLIVIARHPAPRPAFLFGWFVGSAFFYATCYWLTYSMVHYGGISPWLAYALLIPGALIVGVFPALFALALAHLINRWGTFALLAAPPLWAVLEWGRLSVTGQLWNALGYSQAFHPLFIQMARWGGVYAISFLLISVNASIALALCKRDWRATLTAALILTTSIILVVISNGKAVVATRAADRPFVTVVALQPNVPMDLDKSPQDLQELLNRHLVESQKGLAALQENNLPRLVIWPESPMNFAYGQDSQLREILGRFSQQNHTSLLFNSLELAPNNGFYNSALLINEEGRLVAQYDKIRLMPFGEYVPLPRWLPGSKQVKAIVGGFEAGNRYALMPVGPFRAGVFICIESAYPWIPRTFTSQGADVLINISNDGYLGPTAVMKQHLANTIFRAVENGRPLLRVTNTGISAYITPRGELRDATSGFQTAIRIWTLTTSANEDTFYARHGDLFVALCGVISLLTVVLSFVRFNK